MSGGWENAKLGEVCELIKRGVAPKYINEGGICVINQKCIRDHLINLEPSRRHNVEVKAVNLERYICIGDVLVNSTGIGTLGRVAQVRSEPEEPTTVDTHVTIVRPKLDMFYPDFFGYMLIRIEGEIARSGEGVGGQTELARVTLEQKFEASFPESIPEQKRIVAILDEAFATITQAVANTEKNLANARELFESYLNNVFTQKGEGWVEKPLGEVCVLQRGFDLPKRQRLEGDFPLVSSSGVIDSHVEPKVEGPGVATGRSGSIGSVFFIDQDYWPLNTVLYVKEFYRNDPYFVYYLLKQFDLKKYASGTGVPTLNRNHVHNVPVYLPNNVDVQKQITQQLDRLLIATQNLESIYKQKLTALAELKQSILQKAFAGELIMGVETTSPEFTANVLAFAYHRHLLQKRNKTFGRVKAQKILHLAESIGGIDLGRKPIKAAAGPNDFQHMLRAEKWAKDNKFFEFVKKEKGYEFKKLSRYNGMIDEAFLAIQLYRKELDEVIELLLPMNKKKAEVFTTVHAAWNELLFKGEEFGDDEIIYEARDNWHSDKLKIPELEFREAIRLIRAKGVVPDGKISRMGGQGELSL